MFKQTIRDKIESRFFRTLKPLLYREARQHWLPNCVALMASLILPAIAYRIEPVLAIAVGLPLLLIVALCGTGLLDSFLNTKALNKSKNFTDLKQYINNIIPYATRKFGFSSELTSEEIQEIFSSGLNDNQMEYLVNLIGNNTKINYSHYLHVETLLSKEDFLNNQYKLEQETLEKKKLREREIKANIDNFLSENNLPGQIRPHIIGNVIGQNIEKEFRNLEVEKDFQTML